MPRYFQPRFCRRDRGAIGRNTILFVVTIVVLTAGTTLGVYLAYRAYIREPQEERFLERLGQEVERLHNESRILQTDMASLKSRLADMQATLRHTRRALREAELINLAHEFSDDLASQAKTLSPPGRVPWMTDCFFQQTQRLLSVVAALPSSRARPAPFVVRQEHAVFDVLRSSSSMLTKIPSSQIDRIFESAARVCSDATAQRLNRRIQRLAWGRAVVERALASSPRLPEWVGEKWREPKAVLHDYRERLLERAREFQDRMDRLTEREVARIRSGETPPVSPAAMDVIRGSRKFLETAAKRGKLKGAERWLKMLTRLRVP